MSSAPTRSAFCTPVILCSIEPPRRMIGSWTESHSARMRLTSLYPETSGRFCRTEGGTSSTPPGAIWRTPQRCAREGRRASQQAAHRINEKEIRKYHRVPQSGESVVWRGRAHGLYATWVQHLLESMPVNLAREHRKHEDPAGCFLEMGVAGAAAQAMGAGITDCLPRRRLETARCLQLCRLDAQDAVAAEPASQRMPKRKPTRGRRLFTAKRAPSDSSA